MERLNLKLEQEELQKLVTMDASIRQWESQLGQARYRVEICERNLFGQYEGRRSMLNGFLQRLGVDPSRVEDIRVGAQGQLLVVLADPPPEPEEAPPTP